MDEHEQLETAVGVPLRAQLRAELGMLKVGPLSAYLPVDRQARPRRVLFGAGVAITLLVGSLAVADLVVPISGAASGTMTVARDMDALVRLSQVIVVGEVIGEGGVRNIARDPNDITRPDPSLIVNAQDYRFRVDEVLKGTTGGTIIVTSARSARVKRFIVSHEVAYPNFVPLKVGTRYVLLLRPLTYDPRAYALGFEPSRFELGDQAVVRSNWTDARTRFPDRPADEFIRELRAAIAAAPQ
jgi:hypothetical protein